MGSVWLWVLVVGKSAWILDFALHTIGSTNGSVSVHLFLTFRTSAIVLPIPVPDVFPSIIQTCERCPQAAYDVVSGRQVALDPSNFIKYCDAYKIFFVSYVSPKLPAAGLLAEASAAHQYRPPMPGSHKVPPAV